MHGTGPVQILLALDDCVARRRIYLTAVHLKAKSPNYVLRATQARAVVARLEDWVGREQAASANRKEPLGRVPAAPHCLILGDCNSSREAKEECLSILAGTTRQMASEIDWTTFKFRKAGPTKHQIDYVFHGNGFLPRRHLAPPNPLAAEFPFAAIGLPNARYGSDHIAIAYEISYTAAKVTVNSPRSVAGVKRRVGGTTSPVDGGSLPTRQLRRRSLVAWAKRYGKSYGVKGNSTSAAIRTAMAAHAAESGSTGPETGPKRAVKRTRRS